VQIESVDQSFVVTLENRRRGVEGYSPYPSEHQQIETFSANMLGEIEMLSALSRPNRRKRAELVILTVTALQLMQRADLAAVIAKLGGTRMILSTVFP